MGRWNVPFADGIFVLRWAEMLKQKEAMSWRRCNSYLTLSLSGCPNPVLDNGFTSGPEDDKVYFTCNEGYKLFKKGWWGEATCIKGSWSGLEQQQCIGN